MHKKLVILILVTMICSCSISPKPLGTGERQTLAEKNIAQLFRNKSQEPLHIDYYTALAMSAQNNLDYRIKLVTIALQAGQLDVAAFTMFPAFNASGSLYTRSNDYSVSGITSSGVETGLSSSTPRTLRTARVALSWNLLDFGMGYLKAKQQSNRVLIAQEETRRELQQLAQDVTMAYWLAFSAQQLVQDTLEFQTLLRQSKGILEKAVQDKTVPKESLLNYQAALLDGERKLIQLKYKYDKAMLDLKHLLFVPVDQKLTLAAPPSYFSRAQNLNHIDLEKMDAVTLVRHPQLQGQHYQERIVQLGLKTVLLQALPGITLNYGRNYDSNKYLLNNQWLDKSVDIAWNLLNLASLPYAYKTAKTQIEYENIKAMALTMAALTETRYAYTHYLTLREEYQLAHQQSENAKSIYRLNQHRRLASLASDQQVILSKIKTIVTVMDENLLLSDLSIALGQLYLSVGVDMIPDDVMSQPLPKATETIRNQFEKQSHFVSFIDNTYRELFTKPPLKTEQKIKA